MSSYCSMQVCRNLLNDNRTEYFSSIFYFYVTVEFKHFNISSMFEMGILKGLQGSHSAYNYIQSYLFRSVPTYDSAI